MFTAYPTYSRYRPLHLVSPLLYGEDVYAIQSSLNVIDAAHLATDGVFGRATAQAIKNYQESKLRAGAIWLGQADGVAGPLTKRVICLDLYQIASTKSGIPFAAIKGQGGFESGDNPGNYSPLHNPGTPKESWDSGLVQENSKVFTDIKGAFTPLDALKDLTDRIDEHFKNFTSIKSNRRLQLAQGSWNAPAWACYLAYEEGATNNWVKANKSETLSPEQRDQIETYMAHVAVYYIGVK